MGFSCRTFLVARDDTLGRLSSTKFDRMLRDPASQRASRCPACIRCGLGLGDEDWSNRVGDAAAEVVFRLAADFPDAVAEGWWRGARRDRAVTEFAGAVEVKLIVCGLFGGGEAETVNDCWACGAA